MGRWREGIGVKVMDILFRGIFLLGRDLTRLSLTNTSCFQWLSDFAHRINPYWVTICTSDMSWQWMDGSACLGRAMPARGAPNAQPTQRRKELSPNVYDLSPFCCYGMICSPEFIFWCPNLHYFRVWLHSEIGPLMRQLRWNEVTRVVLIQYDWCPYKERLGYGPTQRENQV